LGQQSCDKGKLWGEGGEVGRHWDVEGKEAKTRMEAAWGDVKSRGKILKWFNKQEGRGEGLNVDVQKRLMQKNSELRKNGHNSRKRGRLLTGEMFSSEPG